MEKSPQLEQYRNIVPDTLLTEIYHYARALKGLHVVHLNTTMKGGGVSGVLRTLLPLIEELGIRHTRQIVHMNENAFHFTAKLLDMLQGGEANEISPAEQASFLRALTAEAEPLKTLQADAYYIHDFQLVPLAQLCAYLRPALWFCHVDTAQPHPQAEQYVKQFLDVYKLCTFNTPASILPGLLPEQAQVITLGIDPFDAKNNVLSRVQGLEVLARCGIDGNRPLIVQVSRFGKWKNPWQVLEIYRLVKQQIPDAQVALVGALEATDDVKAQEVLTELQVCTQSDPDIHLLSDPVVIGEQQINAFQRYATVVLQRSIREGFGLTVTEAMWKEQPVIGTSATGLQAQIIHGRNGFIANDPSICATYAIRLIQDTAMSLRLGKQAHQHVKEHFLLPMMVLDYLKAIARI